MTFRGDPARERAYDGRAMQHTISRPTAATPASSIQSFVERIAAAVRALRGPSFPDLTGAKMTDALERELAERAYRAYR